VCETWSFTLREENRLRIFQIGVLRRISGPNREEVARDWRRLHNEQLHNFYDSPNIIRVIRSRKMKFAVHVALTDEMRLMQCLVGVPEEKR
jgi:hypothetical protein